jgi:hypothetical protein
MKYTHYYNTVFIAPYFLPKPYLCPAINYGIMVSLLGKPHQVGVVEKYPQNSTPMKKRLRHFDVTGGGAYTAVSKYTDPEKNPQN